MCLFPLPNEDFNSIAYKKGVREFDCGACPECMAKRSRQWAVRCVAESKVQRYGLMITLTYDKYKVDAYNKETLEEYPVDPTLRVDKVHIQKFMKRLRMWAQRHPDKSGFDSSHKIKYLCCSEYGTRTHRAHYHMILFGMTFPDIVPLKKSKRRHEIYTSKILRDLWSFGIVSIDSLNVTGACAAYCTKYVAKSRSDDTFMLASQRIGIDELVNRLKGDSPTKHYGYCYRGQYYAYPRLAWFEYIKDKYKDIYPDIDYRYVNHGKGRFDGTETDEEIRLYEEARLKRRAFYAVRDQDLEYKRYISHMMLVADISKPSVESRIAMLSGHYDKFKVQCYRTLARRQANPYSPAPNSKCVSAHYRWLDKKIGVCPCRYPSRHKTASDTHYKRSRIMFSKFNLLIDPFDGELVHIDTFPVIKSIREQLKI